MEIFSRTATSKLNLGALRKGSSVSPCLGSPFPLSNRRHSIFPTVLSLSRTAIRGYYYRGCDTVTTIRGYYYCGCDTVTAIRGYYCCECDTVTSSHLGILQLRM
ncbi:hypothetical protein PoB_000575300 [Plakobranchus ocellatus]|uniref:Uncharacterized protein n=1 Tax=Plakobranchus ocellatus TaxID=259542 RepID=A0AAV3Y9R2_9GAST|nr:hypothetical protein PoB_000575300 [Plakobranchus ocellatus]